MVNHQQNSDERVHELASFNGIAFDKELDVREDKCPLPLLKAKLAMNNMPEGCVLKVLATDRGSLRDFPSFSRISGHQLLLSGEFDGICVHILRKKQEG